MLQCVQYVVQCDVMQCGALCGAVCYSVLQCVAVCYSLLQCRVQCAEVSSWHGSVCHS